MHCALKTAMTSALSLALAAPAAAQYGQPNTPYGTPAPGYGQPSPYGAPTPGPGQPGAPYGSPAPGYGQPSGPYGAPAPTYGAPPGAYTPPPSYGAPPAGAYGANTAYPAPEVRCDNTGAIVGGLLGALGGGVLGSNVAGHGNKTGGTVLGALAGGGLGAFVGHAHDRHQCDQRGAYWAYGDTVPYQVDNSVAYDPRAAEYASRGCRLAPAAVNDQETRYIRVCPDPDGRYRVTQ